MQARWLCDASGLGKPQDFRFGDLVAYWRNQKWEKGVWVNEGRWYGTAVVIGHVGRNLVILHRRHVLRCAPEQVRHATQEEKTLISTPQTELLGIKDMITKGNLQRKQFVDLVAESYPPGVISSEPCSQEVPDKPVENEPPVAAPVRQPDTEGITQSEEPPPFESPTEPLEGQGRVESTASSSSSTENPPSQTGEGSASGSSYGPIRRRVTGKDGPMTLWRPQAMQQDDLVSMLKEVAPRLVDEAFPDPPAEMSDSVKRQRSEEPELGEASQRAATRARVDEVLSVVECSEVFQLWQEQPVDVCLAEYMRKKLSKEIPHSGNAPELHKKVDDGKRLEWENVVQAKCCSSALR